MQALEGRAAPAVFSVTNVSDAGPGSLRQAVLDTNAAPGADTITFDTGFFGAQRTISLSSSELSVTDALTITGPGANLLTVRRDPAAATNFRVFTFAGAAPFTATLSAMTVSGGQATNGAGGASGGGIFVGGGTLTVHNAVVRGDSLHGDREPTYEERIANPNAPWRRTPYAVALAAVRELKSKQANGLEVGLLVAGRQVKPRELLQPRVIRIAGVRRKDAMVKLSFEPVVVEQVKRDLDLTVMGMGNRRAARPQGFPLDLFATSALQRDQVPGSRVAIAC